MEGWIKLHRKLKEKGYYKNPKYVLLWIHLLLSANHREKELLWNKKIIIVKKGELLTGRKQLSVETGLAESTIEKILNLFKSEHQIEQQKTNKFRLISIINWEDYQSNEQEKEQQRNNKGTTKEQQRNTNKNDKNDKNEKKDIYTSPRLSARDSEFEKFWTEYPRKVGKRSAKKKWDLLIRSSELTEKVFRALAAQKKSDQWQQNGGQFIPHPSTWLNQGRWEDEIETYHRNEDPIMIYQGRPIYEVSEIKQLKSEDKIYYDKGKWYEINR